MKYNILIVDDEKNILSSLELALQKHYHVFCAENGNLALETFEKNNIHIVFLDLTLEDTNGISVLKKMKQINPHAEIIIITATNDIPTAVAAIKHGAYDYVTKPYEISRLRLLASKAIEKIELANEVNFLKAEQTESMKENFFIGNTQVITNIKKLIHKLSSIKSTVLITGESGTGKEVVARAIHFNGKYKDKPFVPVHTGALSSGIIESEIFGHEKGAFTGAHSRKIGKFEYANGGTIFLDEISTMNSAMQIKLLRVLQDKTFTRVGSSIPIKVDLRIIAATNVQLEEEIKKGKFREDLYYRLNVVKIDLPPLKNRRPDIQAFADYFLQYYCKEFQKNISGFSPAAIEALHNYNWPGNIRELKNIIERSVVLTENNTIEMEDLPFDMSIQKNFNKETHPKKEEAQKGIKHMEREYLIRILKEHNWNKVQTAEVLGIHRNTLLYKIKKLNITKEYL